jgi:hypothetical protein
MKKTNDNISKGYFKSIPLYPTAFFVDVWVCNNQDNIGKYFNKRYGASAEYYKEDISNNQVCTLVSTDNSELKGYKAIVMRVNSWDNAIIVHELMHVIFYLAKETDIEVD